MRRSRYYCPYKIILKIVKFFDFRLRRDNKRYIFTINNNKNQTSTIHIFVTRVSTKVLPPYRKKL